MPNNPREMRQADRNSPSPVVAVAEETPSLTIGDIYFTLFRHKFKIIICALLGLVAAFVVYKDSPKTYQSDAKLFIRYVMESRTPGRGPDDTNVRSPDSGGVTILNSELEILTSLDIAGKVVDTIGADKIVEGQNGGDNRNLAILVLAKNLQTEVPARSSVLHLVFTHTNPEIVQPVLRELINFYLKKHVEIHRSAGLVDDFLTQETDHLRNRLAQTEEDLRRAKSKAGVASVDDAKKAVTELTTRVRQAIYETEMELAERSAFVKAIGSNPKSANVEASAPPALPSDEVINAYGRAVARVDVLHRTEQELLIQFTPENSRVKETQAQLAEAEVARKQLEESYPTLASLHAPRPAQGAANGSTADLLVETARLKAAQAKIAALNEQLEKLRSEAIKIDTMETEIVDLNRRKEIEETNYRKYAASLEQARLDEAMSTGPVSNISEIQSPSPPTKAKSKKKQIMMLCGIAGIIVGLAWAFSIELFFDTTIKRPIEVERKLNIPLFLTVPVVDKAFIRQLEKKPPPGKEAPLAADLALAKKKSMLDNQDQALQQYHATLRDRLIQYFDDQNLVHKPKLVAVTGLARNAGVTTTAAGLAQSLSETGEGNVLLVDMTAEQGSAQQYFKGKAISNLEETLQTKDRALVQENLYVVTEGSKSDHLSRNMPQRFTKLLPKLKASDFDYIIFDMPPVNQISITPRLAGFMDMVLMVIESEKTDLNLVQRATTLLANSKAHLGVVLNKNKAYVPEKLHQDNLGNS